MAINIMGTTTHGGLVLGTFERNGYNDSDFIAAIWNPQTDRIEYIEYDSTRYGGYGSATPDATHDIIASAERYLADVIAKGAIDRAVQAANTPVKGSRVRSLTKRGRNVGIEGTVMWCGEQRSRHGTWSYGHRVGVKVDGETRLRYLDQRSVELIGPPTVDEAAIRRSAAVEARRHRWSII